MRLVNAQAARMGTQNGTPPICIAGQAVRISTAGARESGASDARKSQAPQFYSTKKINTEIVAPRFLGKTGESRTTPTTQTADLTKNPPLAGSPLFYQKVMRLTRFNDAAHNGRGDYKLING
ncbi:MAG: hypothetical protein WD511_01025 [Balneolaceae bacterium]